MNLKVIVILFAVVLVMGSVVCARVGHTHDIYESWHPPGNPKTSCCSGGPTGDCRPTRAKLGDDGLWQAWNGQRWLTVPEDRVLPPNYAGDGRSHICEKLEFIYCFTPGEIRG